MFSFLIRFILNHHIMHLQCPSCCVRDVHTYSGLSLAFFGISTMPLAFERVCSSPDTTELMATALPLIGCGFDQARKSVS
jgi:hypothetical protein